MSGKNSKRKILKFAAFMAVCGIIGGIMGFIFGSVNSSECINNIVKAIRTHGLIPSAVLFAAVNILLSITSAVKYTGAKKKLASVTEDDDNGYIAVENSLNMPALLSGILAIFNVTILPVIIYFTDYSSFSEKNKTILIISITALYIVFILFSFLLSRCIVELIKKINPEKNGDLFDLNFQKSWENSCDEAQKMIMYKAAYKSFNSVKYTCIALWVICLISQLVFKTGILPGICVGIIFIASSISYSIEVMKLEKYK